MTQHHTASALSELIELDLLTKIIDSVRARGGKASFSEYRRFSDNSEILMSNVLKFENKLLKLGFKIKQIEKITIYRTKHFFEKDSKNEYIYKSVEVSVGEE